MIGRSRVGPDLFDEPDAARDCAFSFRRNARLRAAARPIEGPLVPSQGGRLLDRRASSGSVLRGGREGGSGVPPLR